MTVKKQTNPHQDRWPILLVDDEIDVLFTSKLILERAGLTAVEVLPDSRKVMAWLEGYQGQVSVVVLDLRMPSLSGKGLLAQIRQQYPDLPVIIMTAAQEVEDAVACMKMGAQDYLVKPVEESRFVASVVQQVEMIRLRQQVVVLKEALLNGHLQHPEAFAHVIFRSPRLLAVLQYLESVTRSTEPILLLGETGVGKGLLVEALHHLLGLHLPLVTVNVGGLDDFLFSDTLFGHVKGAFTGADSHRSGMIAAAKKGILFLDEIADLSSLSQVKLLQLIQDGIYYPLGSDVRYSSEARIVCATNRDLSILVKEGRFRADLYYRLKVHQVWVPALRERPEDLAPLTRHFLEEAAKNQGRATPTPPPELFTLLATYSFPGNVRELRAMVYDAVTQHGKGILSLTRFRELIGSQATAAPDGIPAPGEGKLAIVHDFPTLEEAREFLLHEALERAGGNQSIAATLLGISRRALNGRLSRLHFEAE